MNTMFLEGLTPDLPPVREPLVCSSYPDLWYSGDSDDVEYAKHLCKTQCPIRYQCLEAALRRQEPTGVWGGVWLKDGRPVEFENTKKDHDIAA